MRHPVSGEIKQVTEQEFLKLFDRSVREVIQEKARKEGVDAVVCFECIQLDSPMCGNRTALVVGPGCSLGVADIEGGAKLGDLPSTFQYPRYIWPVNPVKE